MLFISNALSLNHILYRLSFFLSFFLTYYLLAYYLRAYLLSIAHDVSTLPTRDLETELSATPVRCTAMRGRL